MKSPFVPVVLLLPLASAHAAMIYSEDFEGETGVPAGMEAVLDAAGAVFNIVGGNGGGQAGQIISNTGVGSNAPGGYLRPMVTLDFTQTITISFDAQLDNEAGADDVMFLLGDTRSASGSGFHLFHVFITESLANNDVFEANGGGRIDPPGGANNSGAAPIVESWAGTAVSDSVFFSAQFVWTPTTGTTGVLSGTINGETLTTPSRTLPATGDVGFGSLNDTARFDNIVIDSVPEPAVGILLLGGFGLALRRKR